ncbi:hypothetical protein B566_EDAN002848 [Ephemera danica]|nr:hypothetical protein B566_EDAN002848 [Ephemera danica]
MLQCSCLLLLLSSVVYCNELETTNRREFCPLPCSLPLVSLGGTDYYFHISSKLTWMEAYQVCSVNGLRLLSIETVEEDRLIKRAIAGSGEVFWTSGNDLEVEGEFVWRSTGQRFNYTGWGNGEPQNHADHEHCVFLGHWSGDAKVYWLDAPCMWKHFFICEKKEM